MKTEPTTSNFSSHLQDADRAYKDARAARIQAVLTAHADGASYHAIGRALGISHVAARKLVLNHREAQRG